MIAADPGPREDQDENAPAMMGWQIELFQVEQTPYKRVALENQIRSHWIISHVLHGEVEETTLSDTETVRAGDVMIHPPFIPFSEKADRPGTHQWLMLDIRAEQHIGLFHQYPIARIVRLSDPHAFNVRFQQLLRLWKDTGAALRHVHLSVLVLQIVEQLLNDWKEAGGVPRQAELISIHSRFMPVIQYMNNRLPDKINRHQLAELVHLNANYLDRLFLEAYGLTPMQMLRDLRIRQAKHLLENSAEPMDAVAARCGLGNATYLNRVFLKWCGMTPGQYRDLSRKSSVNRIYGV